MNKKPRKSVAYRTGKFVYGCFTKDSYWVKVIGPIEARLSNEYEPKYSGVYKCEVLGGVTTVRPIVVPVEPATPKEFWENWSTEPYWKWFKNKYPEEPLTPQQKQEADEFLTDLTVWNSVNYFGGLMNLFHACKDEYALTDTMSKEDCDKVWVNLESAINPLVNPRQHKERKTSRDLHIANLWEKDLRHFVSYVSRRVMSAFCDQNDSNFEYVRTVLNCRTYSHAYDISSDKFMVIEVNGTPVQHWVKSSQHGLTEAELESCKVKVMFIDGQTQEVNLLDIKGYLPSCCVNMFLGTSGAKDPLYIPLLEKYTMQYSWLASRKFMGVYKYGNLYLPRKK